MGVCKRCAERNKRVEVILTEARFNLERSRKFLECVEGWLLDLDNALHENEQGIIPSTQIEVVKHD